MITIHLIQGTQKGTITFSGDEVAEPCEMAFSGDFTLQSIQDLFWHITLTADGPAQGIYELTSNICPPDEVLRALSLSSINVTGVPQDWQEEMDSADQDLEELLEDGYQV